MAAGAPLPFAAPPAPAGAWAKAKPKIVPEPASPAAVLRMPPKASPAAFGASFAAPPPFRAPAAASPSAGGSPAVATAAPQAAAAAADADNAAAAAAPPPIAMTEAQAQAAFNAMMRESKEAEAQRTQEDVGAAALVGKFQAQLTADVAFRDVFNPARDGDCLMRCAVKHDFDVGGESLEATVDRAEAGGGAWQTVGSVPGERGNKGSKGSKGSKGGKDNIGDNGIATEEEDQVLSADELRIKVVARVKENLLGALEKKAVSANAAAQRNVDATVRARAAVEFARLRGAATSETKAVCDAMARPGVVMGEDELQALADVRQACVEVRSVICVQTSSDLGAFIPPKLYWPTPLPQGRPRVGKGDTLVLLHELRAARMSHYQLIQFASI